MEPAATVQNGILVIGAPVPLGLLQQIGHMITNAVPSAIVVTGT